MAKTSSETQRRKSRVARKGKYPPRGTETTVLTYPRSAPRGTGKAGENGQHSGEVGGSSAWTRPSAPECGDTLKALSGDHHILYGILVRYTRTPNRRMHGKADWDGGQENGAPKACHQQAPADSRGSRSCVCENTFAIWRWQMQGENDELTSCRGPVQSAWQKPPVRRKGGRAGCPQGKCPPRGKGTTVLTYPRSAPRGTGKAGENGQHSGEVGGSSAWTRPSAPECGDTLKALSGDQRPI